MSSRSIYKIHSAAIEISPGSARRTLAPVVSICNSPAYTRSVEAQPTYLDEGNGLDCVRGVCSAFVLEGGLALLVYGVWHLWHLVR